MTRLDTMLRILKGLGMAIAITLGGMAVLAALVIFTPMSDGLLTTLNQLLKVVSIFFGALIAVGRGGEKGLAMGALVGLSYMVLGYLIYSIIDGAIAPAQQIALELLLSALIGAVSGVICANLKPGKRRSRFSRKLKPI
ncbi:TIGR04086 family membrane protein [Eubacteriales bacterium OttesenSCG-928-N13]|nr:TIGR04086 family membrane protein [Eubacteriales bacterium OttesenSCG-928-N13]